MALGTPLLKPQRPRLLAWQQVRMDAGRGIPVILKMPLTMETAAALIQRQAENFFFFKAPGFPGRGAPAPRELPPGSRLQLRAHRVHPVMPEHRGPLSTSLTHLPACLPPSQVRVEGWHLGFQVGQGGLELLQGRLRLRNRLWKELGQQGKWTSM